MRIEYYLRSIDRRWRKELKKASGKILVFSPYLTSTTAESVLKDVKSGSCEIYTRFSVEDFATGSSSLKTLKLLAVRGFKLYKSQKLHAKMIIVPGVFASIGSQNLTSGGMHNREASVVIDDPKEVAKIEKMVKNWIVESQPITDQMIREIEELLPPLQRKFKELQHEIMREERKNVIQKIEPHLDNLGTANGRVPLEIARKFIIQSAWWEHPRWGSWSRCIGDVSRIEGSESNWYIYESNSFMVGKAISRCRRTLSQFLEQASSGKIMPFSELKTRLTRNVHGAVTNVNGEEYCLYQFRENYMKFGNHAINVEDFVNLVLKMVPVAELYD